MKATEQYFVFVVLYRVVLPFTSVDEIYSVTIQMKAIEQNFPVVLFTLLCRVDLTFESE